MTVETKDSAIETLRAIANDCDKFVDDSNEEMDISAIDLITAIANAAWDAINKAGHESPHFNPMTHIKIAADCVELLRPCDVDRVVRECPMEHRPRFVNWLCNQRLDIDEQIVSAIRDYGIVM